jgi:hypothetical protein
MTGVDTTTTDATTKSASTTEAIVTVTVTSTDDSNTEGASTTETTTVAESVYSTVVPTTTDITITKADTTTIEATSIAITSASTEVTSTAEITVNTQTTATAETTASSGTTSIIDTTTAPTSIYSTTTTEGTTTTAAELPAITDFQLRGASIYSNRIKGNYLFFSGSFPGYTPATFRVEATSGRLLIDNSLAVCAFFEADKDVASLTICRDPLGSQQIAISCTPPAKEGDVLSCSVPAQTCVATQISFFEVSTTCTPTGEMLTDTSTNFIYGANQNIPVMGKITNGVNFVVHAV